jgi:hypothetical protein
MSARSRPERLVRSSLLCLIFTLSVEYVSKSSNGVNEDLVPR